MIFIYGVVAPGFRLPENVQGVGETPAPLRIVAEGSLAAVVSDVPAAPTRREDLEQHVTVMAALADAGTIVPLRFGTLAQADEEMRAELLIDHAAQLAAVLNQVAGCVQMTLKAIYHEDVLMREAVAADPKLKATSDALQAQSQQASRDDWIRLGERVARVTERLRERDERALAERVAALAEEVLVEEPTHERMAARLQLLVKRHRREALDILVQEIADENSGRFVIRYLGPLAPYSFTDLTLDTAVGAWG